MARKTSLGCLLLLVGAAACVQQPDSKGAEKAATLGLSKAELLKLNDSELQRENEALDDALNANPDDPAVQAWRARMKVALDERSGLLLSVSTDAGTTVKFYEPAPGALVYAEIGQIGTPPILRPEHNGQSFEEIYKFVRPQAAIPAALVAADRRAEEAAAQMPVEMAEPESVCTGANCNGAAANPAADDPASVINDSVEKAFACDWFQNNVCQWTCGMSQFCQCNFTAALSQTIVVGNSSWYTALDLGQQISLQFMITRDNGPISWHWNIDNGFYLNTGNGSSSQYNCGGWAFKVYCYRKSNHTGTVYNVDPGERFHFGHCAGA